MSELKAGRLLDAKIAIEVMGHSPKEVAYSIARELDAANNKIAQLVDELKKLRTQ